MKFHSWLDILLWIALDEIVQLDEGIMKKAQLILTFLVRDAVIQNLAFRGKWMAINRSVAITVMNIGLEERLSAPMTMWAVHTDLPAKSSPM